ncbi:unnamed protein product [Vitrella brassicaformis CCMP3155]|uniref:Major facilitator superfamily (MFS) profile domain-containing protein n=1 Tax=Vitrella brassicaformis (strain CCMP3155) TaxID=1169540 RepID=A0A0G4FB57_VITBC|nr:unnamed protein product [Vitrella brassicaformis CCMP3155]|eukprot:CEM10108.1 unnamed protein product [Vitrella brassicaformis CCMP3155]
MTSRPTFRRNLSDIVTETTKSHWQTIFSKKYCYTTMVLAVCAFCVNLTSYGLLYALPQTFPDLEGGFGNTPAYDLLQAALFEVLGCFALALLGELLPRVRSLTYSAVGSGIFLFMLLSALVFWSAPLAVWSASLAKLTVIFQFQLAYLSMSEVYPTACRTTGASLIIACGRVGAIVSPLLFESSHIVADHLAGMNLTAHPGSQHWFFYTALSLVNFVVAVICLSLPFETRGAALMDMEMEKMADTRVVKPVLWRSMSAHLHGHVSTLTVHEAYVARSSTQPIMGRLDEHPRGERTPLLGGATGLRQQPPRPA